MRPEGGQTGLGRAKERKESMRLQRLREQRQRKGLTQIELAHRAGVNPASVVRAEQGHEVRVTNARRYAHALDVTVGDLVEAGRLPLVI
jgi:transcriptional regulator with XRE-family HTH domain